MNRRSFLKLAGVTIGGAMVGGLPTGMSKAVVYTESFIARFVYDVDADGGQLIRPVQWPEGTEDAIKMIRSNHYWWRMQVEGTPVSIEDARKLFQCKST